MTESELGRKTLTKRWVPPPKRGARKASGIEGRTGEIADDRPDTSWVCAASRDRCQRVPTRHNQMPNRPAGGDLTML